MQREVKELLRLGHLHDVALIDNAYPVGYKAHYTEVVGDEQIGHVPLLLELFEEVQHLGAYGHVQGGDGLVRHHQLRFHDHGPRKANALALSAGKLVGITGQVLGQKAHLGYHVLDLLHPVRLVLKEVEVVKAL